MPGGSLENWRSVCACVRVCETVCFHARTQALQTKKCFHSVIKLTSMQTIPHVWTDSMGIPRGQKVHVNRLRLSSRAGPPQRCSGTTPGAFTWSESKPGLPGITLERWRPRKTQSFRGRKGRRFPSSVTCCPSETGPCAPAHELSSRYAGRRDAQPSLQMRQMSKWHL